MLADKTDEQLVSAALGGDDSAFGMLADRYRGMAFGVAFHILGDFEAARDAAQDALVRAYLEMPTLREPGKFGGWLYQIARMVALRMRRSRRGTLPLDQEPVIHSDEHQYEKSRQARDALDTLSENDRLTVILHYVDGYSHEEIGSMLGASPATIKTRLYRARGQLREEMLSAMERSLKDERSVDTRDIGVGVQWFGTPCHCRCCHCLLFHGNKTNSVRFERAESLARKFLAWKEELGLDNFSVNLWSDYTCDSPQHLSSLGFNREHGVGGHYAAMNGTAVRSQDDLREFLLRLKADGITTIGVTFYGLRDLHDEWSGRQGDFDYTMLIARTAAECGLQRNESIILSKKSASELPALVEMLDSLPGEKVRYVFPWDYRGSAKSIESERVNASRIENLPDEIRQCITRIGHKGYRSEAEWIRRIQAGDVPRKGRRFYIITVWDDNVEWLEREDCAAILRRMRESDERLHQAIPSLSTLARLYGRKSGQKVYCLRDLEWKWTDLYLQDHPEIDPTGRMNDLSNVVMWH